MTDDRAAEDDDLTWRWHDNRIHALRFDVGEPEKQDWRSDLVLDIDYITEWLCGPPSAFRFNVAAATLIFHGVADLSIGIDQGESGGRNAMSALFIDRVERVRRDTSFDYWNWSIRLSAPKNGMIAFCATGFTQTLRGAPRLTESQDLARSERPPL